jgi:hypothetical protein
MRRKKRKENLRRRRAAGVEEATIIYWRLSHHDSSNYHHHHHRVLPPASSLFPIWSGGASFCSPTAPTESNGCNEFFYLLIHFCRARLHKAFAFSLFSLSLLFFIHSPLILFMIFSFSLTLISYSIPPPNNPPKEKKIGKEGEKQK